MALCMANNCNQLILTTEDSTLSSENFTHRPDLETADLSFRQTVTQLVITVQHSVFTDHDLQWIAIPKYTMQMAMVVRVSKDKGHYELQHATKIRVQSSPLQCISCFDSYVPMHPIICMPASLCPKANVLMQAVLDFQLG